VRLNATSVDRNDEWRATWRVIRRQPITGIGPGNLDLLYRTRGGATVTVRYAHDEYLQFLAEEGAIGFALLAGGLVLTTVALVRGMRAGRPLAAASLSAWAALLVHSSLDFLWHIPAVVLLPMALVALSLGQASWYSPST
jgi:O-antigen ligase